MVKIIVEYLDIQTESLNTAQTISDNVSILNCGLSPSRYYNLKINIRIPYFNGQ